MPLFWFAGTLMHATAALVAAFFVFFAAQRTQWPLRLAGVVLGCWLVGIAIVVTVFDAVRPPDPAARLPQLTSTPLFVPSTAK